MQFSEIRHQERAISILRRALGSGRTHHAYLFDGPAGVGKELTARALAARLLCEDDGRAADSDTCGQCGSCRLLSTENHPDFHLIHRGLHKLHPDRLVRQRKGLVLSVDVIRHFLINPAAMKPAQGRRRVFLIRDAERMNDEAQNALLKTLEEPPGTACLILVTASASRLLPTIRSRCQVVPFALLPTEFVSGELAARLELSPTEARALAALAGGRLGVALHWHQIGLLVAMERVAEIIGHVPEGNPEFFAKALVELATTLVPRAAVEEAEDSEEAEAEADDEPRTGGKAISTDELRDAIKLVLLLIGALYRDALVVCAGSPALRHVPQQQARVDQLAARVSTEQLEAGLLAVSEAERMLDRNVAPQLVGERLAVALLGELSM